MMTMLKQLELECGNKQYCIQHPERLDDFVGEVINDKYREDKIIMLYRTRGTNHLSFYGHNVEPVFLEDVQNVKKFIQPVLPSFIKETNQLMRAIYIQNAAKAPPPPPSAIENVWSRVNDSPKRGKTCLRAYASPPAKVKITAFKPVPQIRGLPLTTRRFKAPTLARLVFVESDKERKVTLVMQRRRHERIRISKLLVENTIDHVGRNNADKLSELEVKFNVKDDSGGEKRTWHLDLTSDDLRVDKTVIALPRMKLAEHRAEGKVIATLWYENNACLIQPFDLRIQFYDQHEQKITDERACDMFESDLFSLNRSTLTDSLQSAFDIAIKSERMAISLKLDESIEMEPAGIKYFVLDDRGITMKASMQTVKKFQCSMCNYACDEINNLKVHCEKERHTPQTIDHELIPATAKFTLPGND